MNNISGNRKPDIKFSQIRALDGQQNKGFEELCVQLLPQLIGKKLSRVDRVEGRGGDGGVEAVALSACGQKIGLQAKFFSALGPSQWRQIDDSVGTAIRKHADLKRYLVCVPLDRTPGQCDTWTKRQAGWCEQNPELNVEWVGLSELMSSLLRPEVNHLLTYWFGCPEFSVEWVAKQTEIAIRQLHDRYTPRLHQRTSAEIELGIGPVQKWR